MLTVKKKIPVFQPSLLGNERKYVNECIDSGWISSLGPFIARFEQAFASFCGRTHAIATNNGTSALHVALLGIGIGPGDEVIVPSLTFVATANAVTYCGAKPVFVDAEPATMNIDPTRIETKITLRTKAIIVVHLYGHPADMDPILDIARRHNLKIVEDAAEAHGALYKGRCVGALGDIATFSFFGNKIITTGEGGMVVTNDPIVEEKIRILCGQGMDPHRKYWFPEIGYNYRMTNVAAALGLAQLENIDSQLVGRRTIAGQYDTAFGLLNSPYLKLPCEQTWSHHVFWAYTVLVNGNTRLSRDEIMGRLLEDGIETRPVFTPMHCLPSYFESSKCYPISEQLAASGLLLPLHLSLEQEDVSLIAERVNYYCGQSML